MTNGSDDPIELLRAELDRYPADRYPVQNATTRFHLGTLLLDADRCDEALEELVAAAALFDPGDLPVEHAKAANMAGVALRTLGRTDDAAGAFAAAARIFDAEGETGECGAALYNLGVIERERDDREASEEVLGAARRILEQAGRTAQAAAAARELGAMLVAHDEAERALPILDRAAELAAESADHATIGSCENVRGLALLALGEVEAAVEALRSAAGAHPRTIRPDGHAMAKANLALAYERTGADHRARLAARQAIATPQAPAPVADQAEETLRRLPDGHGDLLAVLAEEPPEAWPGILGEEIARWAAEDPVARRRESAALAAALADPARDSVDLAEVWLGGLLELPPEPMERLVVSFLDAVGELDEAGREEVRRTVSSGMVRFHGPQWMRLEDSFDRLAAQLDRPETWG